MQQSNPQSQSLEKQKTDEQKKNYLSGMMDNNLMGGVNSNMMPGKKINVFC